jgi:signal transduction histidine kinase
VNARARPSLESLRPVESFAVVRLLLPGATLLAGAILGFPDGLDEWIVIAVVALPWAAAILWVAHSDRARALTPFVAIGDLVVIAAVQLTMPEAYPATHFVALVFIAAHAHFEGPGRGVLIAAVGALLVIGATIAAPVSVDSDRLAFYETGFAVCCLVIAAVIGELRGIETAGRLRAQELSRHTMAGEDEVRRHVADFIHDGPVQELIGLDLILQGATRATERGDSARATELIRQARELAESNVRALRDEIVSLGPYAFEELSFEIAIERCIPVWHRRYGCEVTIDANVDLPPYVANELFRITQEAVANACKHGAATSIHITLEHEAAGLVLRIADNGKGFGAVSPLGPFEPGHIGLASMRERTKLLEGSLDIETRPDGTEVRLQVPRVADARRDGYNRSR